MENNNSVLLFSQLNDCVLTPELINFLISSSKLDQYFILNDDNSIIYHFQNEKSFHFENDKLTNEYSFLLTIKKYVLSKYQLQIVNSLKGVHFETTFILNNQTFEACFIPIVNKIGRASKALISLNNISKIEAKFSKNISFKESFLNSIDENLILINCETEKIEYFNKSADLIFGINSKKYNYLKDLTNLNIKSEIELLLNSTISNNESFITADKEYLNSYGEKFIGKTKVTLVEIEGILYYQIKIAEVVSSISPDSKNEDLFKNLFEISPLPIVILNTNDCVSMANKSFLDIFEYEEVDVIDKKINSLVIPDNKKFEAEQVSNRSLNGDFTYLETIRKTKNGKILDVLLTSYPVCIDGKTNSIIAIYNNVSQLKETSTSLIEVNTELIKKNEELDNFIYSASHDLKSPLTSIMGLIEISKFECPNDNVLKYLSLIQSSVNKLDSFIDQIINYHKNIKNEVHYEKIYLNDLINECIDELKYINPTINIIKKIKIDQNLEFHSDPFRFKNILTNLISNSIKHSGKSNDNLTLSFWGIRHFDTFKFIMKDNGNGIDSKQIDKIFDMFYRGSHDNNGSGIGLYLVKETVKRLGGGITVSSEVSIGTTFEIEIPNNVNETVNA